MAEDITQTAEDKSVAPDTAPGGEAVKKPATGAKNETDRAKCRAGGVGRAPPGSTARWRSTFSSPQSSRSLAAG